MEKGTVIREKERETTQEKTEIKRENWGRQQQIQEEHRADFNSCSCSLVFILFMMICLKVETILVFVLSQIMN